MKSNYLPITSVATIISGGTPKTSIPDYWDGNIPWLSVKDFNNDSKFVYSTEKHITELGLKNSSTNLLKADDIIISARGTVGEMAMIPFDMAFNQSCFGIRANNEKILPHYLYYALKNNIQTIKNSTHGSVFDTITLKDFDVIKIPVPDLETQQKIIHTLSVLDQKIELNSQQNKTLFELGWQLYVKKFEHNDTVDKIELGNFFPVVTGKKDANASSENGKYPFFTCSKTISKIDDYVFDSSAILLAGNGDFNVKFYRGKFDAYQRTYVLIPNNPKYLGFLYWAISYNLPKITVSYRGSVIKFITKSNIEGFKIPFADNKFVPIFMKYLEKIENNNQNIEMLAGIRNTLLPKLMSGKINLENIES